MIEHAPMQLALPAAISSLLNAFGMEVHVFAHSPRKNGLIITHCYTN
jgi:hypothetical protein